MSFIVCISQLNVRSTGIFLLFSDIIKHLQQYLSQRKHTINICWMNGLGQYFLLLAKHTHFLLLLTISLAEENLRPLPWFLLTKWSLGDLSLDDEECRLHELCVPSKRNGQQSTCYKAEANTYSHREVKDWMPLTEVACILLYIFLMSLSKWGVFFFYQKLCK